ncbi:unnamed protein product [Cuscuta epithymum]|uniref:Uncharacterized protein n=1 Tax=Cuscuta epithymum TaxID=186058 RepID=A0AAV0EB70_9ASTE|nr:unnamed protein product [Cuscuta epithymum]
MAENSSKLPGNDGSREPSNGQPLPLPGFSADQRKSLISAFGNSTDSNDRMAGPCLEKADWNG